MWHRYARFRDMRPPKTDTNLYSYHLKLLHKKGFVDKDDHGYKLGLPGIKYVDRINAETARPSVQPKVITMVVIQNGYGGVLMYRKQRQPFIDRWTVPFGKVHNTDASIAAAAYREMQEKVGNVELAVQHVGDCYIRVMHENEVFISTLVHVFYGQVDEVPVAEHLRWIAPREISSLDTAPAVEQIVARTFFRDPYFFEEFSVDW